MATLPHPFTTLHCCCPLVCTGGMNIFLNFANSITSSLLIISLELPVAALSHLHMLPLIQSALATLSRLSPHAGLPVNLGSTEPSLHTTQPASLATPSATHQPVSLGRGVDLPIHAAAQPVSLSILLTRSRSNSFHTASLFLCLRMPHFRCSAPRRKLLLTNLRNHVLLVTLTILVSAEVTLKKIRQDIVTILSKLKTKSSEIELLNGEITTAYTVIQLLQQRISELEEKDRRRGNQQEETPSLQTNSKCLLLGDTNLKKILNSDLGDNCSVKTIPHANRFAEKLGERKIKLHSLWLCIILWVVIMIMINNIMIIINQ